MRHAVEKLHCVIDHASQSAVRCCDIGSPSAAIDRRPSAARRSRAVHITVAFVLSRSTTLTRIAAARVHRWPATTLPSTPLSPIASCVSRSPVFLVPPTPHRFVTLKRSTLLQLLVERNAADERTHCSVQTALVEKFVGKLTKTCQAWLVTVFDRRLKTTLNLDCLRLVNPQKRHYVNVDKQRSVPASTVLTQVGAGVDAETSHRRGRRFADHHIVDV